MATSMEPPREATKTCRCEEFILDPSAKRQKICPCQELKLPQDTPHPTNGNDVPDYSDDDYSGEEFDAYFRSVEDSRGYDVLDFPPCGIIYSTILPVPESALEQRYEFYKGLAQFAIDENNKQKKTNYELEKVVKVNFSRAKGSSYYFTLKVKNNDDADQKSCVCRAAVYEALDGSLNLSELFEDPKFEVRGSFAENAEDLNMDPSPKRQKICPCQELKLPPDTPHPTNGEDVPDYSSDDYSGEEFDAYFRSIEDSRGYDVLDLPPCGSIYSTILPVPESVLEQRYEFYKRLAQFAIDENNKQKKANYELDKVVKVNFLLAQGSTYYFTLKVKNNDDADQKSCVCRATVYEALDDSLNLSELFEDPKFEV